MIKSFLRGLVFFFVVFLILELFLQVFGDRLPAKLNSFYLPPLPAYKQGQTVVLCLGDSITAWGMETSYPALLQQKLHEAEPGKYFVINGAKLGETSESAISTFKNHLETLKPYVVVSMLGQNDYKLIGRSPHAFRIRLFSVLQQLFTVGFNSLKGSFLSLRKQEVPEDAPVLNPTGETWKQIEEQLRIYLGDGKSAERYHRVLDYLTDTGALRAQQAYSLAIELGSEALKNWPKDQIAADYRALGAASLPGHPQAEEFLRYAYELGTRHQLVYIYYAKQLKRSGKREEGLKVAQELLSTADELIDRNKEVIEKEFPELKAVTESGNKLRPEKITAANYKKLYDLLSEHQISLVVLPYPRRGISEIKETLSESPNVQFGDYGNFFDSSTKSYDEFFLDKSGVDFGHLTQKSTHFVATVAAESILRLAQKQELMKEPAAR